MKLAELNKFLKTGEWNDVEFKEARNDVPKSAFETLSAFANCHGGRLVFGVGHPSPSYKNDRAGKAFELFIPGLDKEVDMASDLVKAMFGDAPQAASSQKAIMNATQETGVKTGVKILDLIRSNPMVTREELANMLALTVNGIDWQITGLKAKGILRRVGPDKGGHWEVKMDSGRVEA